MKYSIVILFLMASLSGLAQNGKATTTKKTFNRTTTITQIIQAPPAVVWAILTNANDFSRWNSTIVSLDGEIADGGKIALQSTLDTTRTFKLKVKEFVPDQKLVWGDAMGKRTYLLRSRGDATQISMTEKIGGPMFPLFANQIPDFDASFEEFMADLKQEAERKAGKH